MPEQRDEARQSGSEQQSQQGGASGAEDTTGAGILQQTAAAGSTAQFGGSSKPDGHDQQSQRRVGGDGAGGDGARAPKELLKQTANELRREGRDVARAATERVETLAEQQKSVASGYMETVARAIQSASDTLDEQGFGASAEAIDRVAEQIEDLAATLRSRDPKQLIEDVSTYARRNPAVFLGASMLAGFGLARFVKSGVAPQLQGGSTEASNGQQQSAGQSAAESAP